MAKTKGPHIPCPHTEAAIYIGVFRVVDHPLHYVSKISITTVRDGRTQRKNTWIEAAHGLAASIECTATRELCTGRNYAFLQADETLQCFKCRTRRIFRTNRTIQKRDTWVEQ